MSTYAAYDRAAAHYDGTRQPVGVEIIAHCLGRGRGPAPASELLDAGCGTGAYTAALAEQVRRITAMDLNQGMLAVARAKLGDREASGRVGFCRGSIAAMPFADESFDAVLLNQVLHHLEDGSDPRYGAHARAIAEAFRVLRSGGVIVINACSHRQLRDGFWYYALVPAALEAVLARCAPAGRLESILRDCGFQRLDRIVPREALMQGSAYFDPSGPLSESWRSGDSFWDFVTPQQLRDVEARLRRLQGEGRLQAFMEERDRARRDCGQLSFFVGRRS